MANVVRSSTSTRKSAVSKPSAYVKELDGEHYEDPTTTGHCPHCGGVIQHWDLYADQPYLEGSATKYVTRWRKKGGLADLRKARSLIDKRIAVEEMKLKA